MNFLQQRLRALPAAELRGLARGIEKEGLRARPDATLAETPHPLALGSALTHPHVTTDFSESQLELITGVHATPDACLAELTEIHQVVHRGIGDELIWASSMPCILPEDDRIPIGQYGTSNVGLSKTVYRQGLSWRYGRRMQVISGIHYNFSLPATAWAALHGAAGDERSLQDFQTAGYFGLIRNFRRVSWLLLYLFGASPAVCSSFLDDRPHGLEPLGSGSLYLPYATSLRMGPLGYQSDAQAKLAVSFNTLESYSESLSHALTEPYPAYEKIGIRGDDGYRQLATSLLQIENEFYGTIRPKRSIRTGERPLRALAERGVEYVEVRCMDLDPFSPIGIEQDTLRFLDVFLLHCLLSESPLDTPDEIASISVNQHRVALRGRAPGLTLQRDGGEVALRDWGRELLAACRPIASALDAATAGNEHHRVLAEATRLLDDPENTPSARVLAGIAAHGDSFIDFALARSVANRRALLDRPLPPSALEWHRRAVADSIEEQRRIEASDTLPFEEYRQRYIADTLTPAMRA